MKGLILAVESDPQQAAQLASIAHRLGVELVLRNSVERAFDVFDSRVPDLVLTPALLSLRDDLALTHRLRALGDTGMHIQTLTIPMLESPGSSSPDRRIFSRLRRSKPPAAEVGRCTVNLFAEQITAYLGRAAAARRTDPEPEPPTREISMEMQIVEPDAGVDEIDTWHFFDPQQHRFATLVTTLDEICRQ